jgi:hypothetical protein
LTELSFAKGRNIVNVELIPGVDWQSGLQCVEKWLVGWVQDNGIQATRNGGYLAEIKVFCGAGLGNVVAGGINPFSNNQHGRSQP